MGPARPGGEFPQAVADQLGVALENHVVVVQPAGAMLPDRLDNAGRLQRGDVGIGTAAILRKPVRRRQPGKPHHPFGHQLMVGREEGLGRIAGVRQPEGVQHRRGQVGQGVGPPQRFDEVEDQLRAAFQQGLPQGGQIQGAGHRHGAVAQPAKRGGDCPDLGQRVQVFRRIVAGNRVVQDNDVHRHLGFVHVRR